MSLWVDIGVPLGAAAIAAAAALAGSWSGGRNDHAAWLRVERRAAYVGLVTAGEDYAGLTEEDSYAVFRVLRLAVATVEVVGPDQILDAADKLFRTCIELRESFVQDPRGDAYKASFDVYEKARFAFGSQARQVLG